jgi:hypothetical protein
MSKFVGNLQFDPCTGHAELPCVVSVPAPAPAPASLDGASVRGVAAIVMIGQSGDVSVVQVAPLPAIDLAEIARLLGVEPS